MNKELLKWLTDIERIALQCTSHPDVIAAWAQRLAETRLKLAKTRGMLYKIKFKDYEEEELDSVLEETKDE